MHADVINEEAVERWAALAYGAAAGETGWRDLLMDLARASGAVGASLFTPTPDEKGRNLGEACGIVTPQSMQDWMTYWRIQDPWNSAPAHRSLFSIPGTVRDGHEFIPDAQLRQTAYYNEFSLPNEGGRLICLKVCGEGDVYSPVTHLTLLRPLSGKPFETKVHDALRALWPHLRGSLYGHWSMRPQQGARLAAVGVLDTLPQAAWIVRSDAGVLYANGLAEAEMRSGHTVRVVSNRVCGIGELRSDHVAEALRRVSRGLGWAVQTAAPVAAQRKRVTVRWVSLSASPAAGPSRLTEIWPGAAALLLLDAAREDANDAELEYLVKRYRFTLAERRVLQWLASGDSPQQIADRLGVSTVTIRTHLRSLFDKSGVRRQADLIRLVFDQ